MKKLLETLRYWGQALLMPLYWLSMITPRDKRIWLCGSNFGNGFLGNPRYFYVYMNQFHSKQIQTIWISKNKLLVRRLQKVGLPAYHAHSVKGILLCLRAGVYLFDNYSKDISFWCSGGAVKVNLWHGVPLKKINHDNVFDKVRHPVSRWDKFCTYLRRMSDEKPHHYTLATSDLIGEMFVSAFGTTRNHILQCGYPRNDVLVPCRAKRFYLARERRCLERMRAERKSGKKIVLYMPTFRDSESEFFKIMNLVRVSAFFEVEGIVFYTKLHTKSKLKAEFEALAQPSIVNIDANVDVYGLLKYVDVLVTDYSSIYFDFLLCNKPIVFFPYDYETYLKDSRELYFDYEKATPGEKVYDMEGLMSGVCSVLKEDVYESRRKEIRELMFENDDNRSSERLYRAIRRI